MLSRRIRSYRAPVAFAICILSAGCIDDGPLVVSPPELPKPSGAASPHTVGQLMAYVTNPDAGEVYVIRTTDHAVVNVIPVFTRPQHVTVSPDGRRAYITHNVTVQSEEAVNLTVIRTADASIVATIPRQSGMTLNTGTVVRDGSHIYFTNGSYNPANPNAHVQVMRTDDYAFVATVDAGPHLTGAATPDGERVYMTGCSPCTPDGEGFVTVIRTSDHALLASIPVLSNPNRIVLTPDGSRAYVSHHAPGQITVIRTADNTVEEILDIPFALGLGMSPGGEHLYVINRPFGEVGSVTVIRTSDHGTETVFDVGVNPQTVAVSPGGGLLYITNHGSGTVTVVRASDHAKVAEIQLAEGVLWADFVLLPSADQEIAALVDAVDQLESAGVLGSGRARALRNHLDNALRALERGLKQPALAQLAAFISQVEALLADGVLSEEDAANLIALAESAMAQVEAL